MEITEPRRLYQQLAADLKERIEQGVYLVGDKLPAERFIADEKNHGSLAAANRGVAEYELSE